MFLGFCIIFGSFAVVGSAMILTRALADWTAAKRDAADADRALTRELRRLRLTDTSPGDCVP